MIDNFLGMGVGDTGHYGFCHIMWHAVMIFFFFFLKDRSSLQYFITQGMGQTSIFLLPFALYVILGGRLQLL